MKALITLWGCLLLGSWAIASEEDYAIWSSVDLASNIHCAGMVKVSGRADDGRITSLKIVAFGRTNAISGEDLKVISSFPLDGVKLSHGPGYERLGGYSVHVRLRRIAYDSDRTLQDDTAIITVTEKDGLRPVAIQKTK